MRHYLKRLKNILLCSNIFLLALLIIRIYFFIPKSVYNGYENVFYGKVLSIDQNNKNTKIIIFSKEKLVVNYSKIESLHNLEYGDYVLIVGKLKKPNVNTTPNLFNYRKYLLGNKIFWIVDADKVVMINKNRNIVYELKNLIIRKINTLGSSGNYIKAFIFGINDIDDNNYKLYQDIGISHLFSASATNILLLLSLMKNDKNRKKISIVILLLSLFIVENNISILRSFFYLIISTFFNIKSSRVLLYFLISQLLLIYNPYYIYNIGFLYSFITSIFIVYYISSNINKTKLSKMIDISIVSFLASFPITIYNFFEINLLSILYNMFFIPFVTFVIVPFCYVVIIFSFTAPIFSFIIFLLEKIALLLNSIDILKLVIPKPPIIILITYYLIIIWVISSIKKHNYRYIVLILVILFINSNVTIFNKNTLVSIIDVGQGDSILISFANNKGNILIDTGGNKNYSIAKKTLIPYFKSLGIKKLNFLILSHGDFDHMGEAINLIENFNIENVIFNCGEYNYLEQELIEFLEKKKIKYYSCIKEINIDKHKLKFLYTREYGNENDNSNVVYLDYNNYKLLFMGDASMKREKEILEKYKLKDIDFLKVGHHGSNTSSSKYFIDTIKPKNSFISVGKNNRYGHPKKTVLDNLMNSMIYRTDIDGTIEIRLNRNKYMITTCMP